MSGPPGPGAAAAGAGEHRPGPAESLANLYWARGPAANCNSILPWLLQLAAATGKRGRGPGRLVTRDGPGPPGPARRLPDGSGRSGGA